MLAVTCRRDVRVEVEEIVRVVFGFDHGQPRTNTARIDPDGVHRAEVDHYAAIADRGARGGVPAAAHRHVEVARAGEGGGRDRVWCRGALGDDGRPAVDLRVPHPSPWLEAWIAGREHESVHRHAQSGDPLDGLRCHGWSPRPRAAGLGRRAVVSPGHQPRVQAPYGTCGDEMEAVRQS
jgi:hypothetical protein